ncbi:MAG: aspartyl protease family protein [Rhodospirillales bacterium]|jgi:predicted aspartyl protease|nr:aspartyl protease family protein [Rhodospirillales bacterium]MDP7214854.1 aspartyl protease family protein [Rhodospirillales bacterium]HIJ93277.1 hypothetical protein [Rhodospirillaceae bacterium]
MTDRDTNNNSVIWPAGTISGFFTASGHGNPDEKSFRHPAVKVSFHGGKGEDNNLVGMLDTGADLCTIDQGLADRLDLEDGGEMPVILAGHKSVRIMKKGTILLAGHEYTLSGKFSAAPLRESGNQYDILLGMDFLRHFSLYVNAKTDEVKITFLGID